MRGSNLEPQYLGTWRYTSNSTTATYNQGGFEIGQWYVFVANGGTPNNVWSMGITIGSFNTIISVSQSPSTSGNSYVTTIIGLPLAETIQFIATVSSSGNRKWCTVTGYKLEK